MRKLAALALLALLATVAAGCGGSKSSSGTTTSTSASACDTSQLNLLHSGQLTVATGNPAYPPWFAGGTKSSYWKINDPNNGQGYESAVTYAVAKQLGFSKSQVKWIAVPFSDTYKPGPKNFDIAIQQISYNPQRAKAAAFSQSYFDVNQSVVGLQGTSIAGAKTFSDLKKYKLGAQIGTTSYDYIVKHIKPSQKPSVYDDLNGAVTAVKNHQIDGVVTDFPDAEYMISVQLGGKGVIVGRLPTVGTEEHFGIVLAKGNSLVSCVNKALTTLKQNGTLKQLEQQWITGKAKAPLISQS